MLIFYFFNSELVQWLWPKLLQQELDTFKELQNAHRVRRDSDKMNPSGVAPNVAYSLFEKYGGQQCLEEVDVDVVHNIMTGLGGEATNTVCHTGICLPLPGSL